MIVVDDRRFCMYACQRVLYLITRRGGDWHNPGLVGASWGFASLLLKLASAGERGRTLPAFVALT